MHIADIDGRIHERIKRERQREFQFMAWSFLFAVVVLSLCLFCGGGQ